MLKFVKHNLETIDGVAIYPIISLLICFTFFVGLFFPNNGKKSNVLLFTLEVRFFEVG